MGANVLEQAGKLHFPPQQLPAWSCFQTAAAQWDFFLSPWASCAVHELLHSVACQHCLCLPCKALPREATLEAGELQYQPPWKWNQMVPINNFWVETEVAWESLAIHLLFWVLLWACRTGTAPANSWGCAKKEPDLLCLCYRGAETSLAVHNKQPFMGMQKAATLENIRLEILLNDTIWESQAFSRLKEPKCQELRVPQHINATLWMCCLTGPAALRCEAWNHRINEVGKDH